ncbi:MAG TPA: glycosyltransferase [Croceibacterium sp.]
MAWTTFSIWVSARWLQELGASTHPLFALFAITFIAYVPGFMNAFLIATLLLDRRPARRAPLRYPGVSVLIAAYQESAVIGDTLRSVAEARYPGPLEVLVLDDGSSDGTPAQAEEARARLAFAANVEVRVVEFARNRGKAAVLNDGLARAAHALIVTIDADTQLHGDALRHIVERFLSDPPGTAAVAGAVLVRNAHETLITGAQEWDYFHGIAAVKRMQSLYHGTLVAQGAFSIYSRQALESVGGWPECVGEDIVLTWALLGRGARIGYAEDAVVFTNAPTTFRQFAQQRKRWSRGMVEALHHHEQLLFKPRLTTMFIWWNLLFLPLDLAYTLVFIPGVIAAAFGVFWIAGPLTLLLLPLAAMWNLVIFRIQRRMLDRQGLKLRHNRAGLVFYLLVYTVLMQPVCVWGYVAELAGLTKKWGTK